MTRPKPHHGVSKWLEWHAYQVRAKRAMREEAEAPILSVPTAFEVHRFCLQMHEAFKRRGGCLG